MGQRDLIKSKIVETQSQNQNENYLGDEGGYCNPTFKHIRYGLHLHYSKWVHLKCALSFRLKPTLSIMDKCLQFSETILKGFIQNKLMATEAQELADAVYFLQTEARAYLKEKYTFKRNKRVNNHCGPIVFYEFRM